MGSKGTDKLMPNDTIQPGDYLESAGGTYRLTMRTQGDLVLTPADDESDRRWRSHTSNHNGAACRMDTNGSFGIYDVAGNLIKRSCTAGNLGAWLFLGEDGIAHILDFQGNELSQPWDNGPMCTPGPAALFLAETKPFLGQLERAIGRIEDAVLVRASIDQIRHDIARLEDAVLVLGRPVAECEDGKTLERRATGPNGTAASKKKSVPDMSPRPTTRR